MSLRPILGLELLQSLEWRVGPVCRSRQDICNRLWKLAIISRCLVGLYLDVGLICEEGLEQSRTVVGI